VPGHGTCPHALSEAELEDWIAAVRIAARGVRERVPDNAPLVVVGFSNGGALSVDYAISAVEEPDLPQVDAVVLFSPMIGIMPAAKLSRALYAGHAALRSGEGRMAVDQCGDRPVQVQFVAHECKRTGVGV
jgi:alpha-beta hydrolase superfamily lysophospholipase